MRASAALLLLLGISSCLTACSKSEPDPDLTAPANAEKERAQEKAKVAMTRVRADDVKRTDAIVNALARSGPRPELGPCPVVVVGPQSLAVVDGGPPTTLLPIVSDRTMRVAFADVATTPGLRLTRIGERISSELAHPSRGMFAGRLDETIENLGTPGAFAWELDVVIDERVEPRIVDATHFEGGLITGRGILYSYLREEVICASTWTAGSSHVLRVYDGDPKSARDMLLRDLETEAMRAAALSLVRVAPKGADADASAKADASADASAKADAK